MFASAWDFQQCGKCDQQKLRPACAYAQSDQSLCLLLEYSMSVKLLTEHLLEVISLKGDCICSSESTPVKMPHCWKSHVTAHMYLGTLLVVAWTVLLLLLAGIFTKTLDQTLSETCPVHHLFARLIPSEYITSYI